MKKKKKKKKQQNNNNIISSSNSNRNLPHSGYLLSWTGNRSAVHEFVGGPCGNKTSEAPHIDSTSSSLAVFISCFVEVIRLLVVEINWCYQLHLGALLIVLTACLPDPCICSGVFYFLLHLLVSQAISYDVTEKICSLGHLS
jgi:hypothetical protein